VRRRDGAKWAHLGKIALAAPRGVLDQHRRDEIPVDFAVRPQPLRFQTNATLKIGGFVLRLRLRCHIGHNLE